MPAHPLTRFACSFLLVSAASPSGAQIHLRETARIDPGIVRTPGPGTGGGTTEGFFSPCSPPYDDLGPPVITRRSVFPGASLSLAALTCPYCPSHHMEGQLTAGSGYVRLELNRPAGLGGEINGDWFHFREAWGYDVYAVFDQAIPDDSVLVTFTMHYVDFPPPNIEYIEVYYVRRMFTLSTRADPPAPEQGGSADLSAWVTDQCGGAHPVSHTLTARILSGGERGQLLDPRTQERGQVLAHLLPPQGYTPTVVFLADGQDADSTTEVEIEFSASLSEVPPVRVTLQVRPGPTCPVIRLAPPDPAPGDTCRITLIKKRFDGTLTEYPPGQLFSVMLYPDEAGTLFSPHRADTSEYFSAIPADGLLWLAAPEIAEESLSVYLWVNEVPAGEGRRGSDGDDGTREREQGEVRRLSQLHQSGGIRPLGPEQDVCNAAWAVLRGSIQLELIDPDDLPDILHLSSEAEMPDMICTARLDGFSGGTVIFEWRLMLNWTNEADNPDRHFRGQFHGQSSASGSDTTAWPIDWGNNVIGGTAETLAVSVDAGGRNHRVTRLAAFSVVGDNPPSSVVKTGLSLEEQVVVFMESRPKWCHFEPSGIPTFGTPHGYGLMQLDNPTPTDEQVWNWLENRRAGVALLAEKRREARAFPARVREKARSGRIPAGFQNATDFVSDEEILKETFQRYNGGAYWQWVPVRPNDPTSPGAWRPRANPGSYGDRAWIVHSSVRQGNPPVGWN